MSYFKKLKTWDPKRKNHLIALLLAGAFFVPSFVWGINTIATGYQVSTSNVQIDAHGECRAVCVTSGSASYFVPTKTASEWNSFRSSAPAEINVINCGFGGGGGTPGCIPDGQQADPADWPNGEGPFCGQNSELVAAPSCCSGAGVRYAGQCEVWCQGAGGLPADACS